MMPRSVSVSVVVAAGLTLIAFQALHAQPVTTETSTAHVSSTMIVGAGSPPIQPAAPHDPPAGDVSLNFPAADVHELAKIILGDMLKLSYQVEPSATGNVTLVTPHPIARSSILGAFEDALRTSNLALVRRGGAYVIAPLAEAKAQASGLGSTETGFGSETIELRFIAAAELKRILDPVIPDTLTVSDPTRNLVTVTGTAGQRRAVLDLVSQFDTNWLRGMSFALYVPKHTDSRLIVPEVEKLLNGEGSPSAGLVRLITMERINGVLAISAQPQYLEDVKRWIEVLDREGESSEPRLFVYRVENGRSSDLARVLTSAFGGGSSGGMGGMTASAANVGAPAGAFDIERSAAPTAQAAAPTGRPAAPPSSPQAAGPSAATITSDETNNAVLVYATPREYAVIEDALRKLDVVPVQVLIEAAITEVTLTHNLQYGVQWNFSSNGNQFGLVQNTGSVRNPSSSLSVGAGSTIGQAIAAAAQTMPGFNYLFSNGNSITATLNALSGLTTVNVLSAPKMLVLNNHTATLEVGDQVPVVTASSVSTIGTNAPQVNSVDYRDTGVILRVTPRVNSGGLVLLDIAQEVSDVVNTSTSSINSPTIEQRKFATSIAIQDGETIALGGLIKDSHAKGRSGIPLLSSIPIFGGLAGNRADSDERTELLILLTPRVIRSSVDAETVADDLRRKIQALEPLKPIKSFRP